jgi:hypothetical protein
LNSYRTGASLFLCSCPKRTKKTHSPELSAARPRPGAPPRPPPAPGVERPGRGVPERSPAVPAVCISTDETADHARGCLSRCGRGSRGFTAPRARTADTRLTATRGRAAAGRGRRPPAAAPSRAAPPPAPAPTGRRRGRRPALGPARPPPPPPPRGRSRARETLEKHKKAFSINDHYNDLINKP